MKLVTETIQIHPGGSAPKCLYLARQLLGQHKGHLVYIGSSRGSLLRAIYRCLYCLYSLCWYELMSLDDVGCQSQAPYPSLYRLRIIRVLCESFYRYVFHSNTVESDLVHVYIYLYLARQVDETPLSRLHLWTIVSAHPYGLGENTQGLHVLVKNPRQKEQKQNSIVWSQDWIWPKFNKIMNLHPSHILLHTH